MSSEDKRVWALIGGMLALFVLCVPLSISLFDVTYDYTLVTVAAGGAVLGIVSGVLGIFAVLRRESLMGDALSHAALPGVAIAFLLTGRDLGWLLVGAGIAGWLGVLFIRAILQTTRIKQDTAMGMVLAAFFAFGITLLTYIQSRSDASQAGLDNFIFGQAAAIVRKDILLISVVGLIAFALLAAFWKEFKLITFDPEFAAANGFPLRPLDILLSTLIVVAVVLGLQLAGVILMVGLLIAPGVAARQWTNNLGQMIVLAAVFGAFSGASGAIISAIEANLPTGPLIIVVAAVIVTASLTLAPGRGLLWTWIQQRGDRQRFAAQNVMRDIYKHAMQHNDPQRPMPDATLRVLRGQIARIGLHELYKQKLVVQDADSGWFLTNAGVQKAQQDVHNQQLWEMYHQYSDNLQLPLIPENRQQDITKLLSSGAVRKLEGMLEGAMD